VELISLRTLQTVVLFHRIKVNPIHVCVHSSKTTLTRSAVDEALISPARTDRILVRAFAAHKEWDK
jgi:hypothetical protein